MNDTLLNQDDRPEIDPDKKYFEELVGENKKFKDPEALARGKFESDNYISILERKLDEMRQDYTKLREDSSSAENLRELIDQLKTQQLASNENTTNVNEADKPAYDPKEIESLVSSKIQEHENSKKQQENFDLVRNKLKERFGSNYQNVFKQQIDDLGLTEEFVNDLARKHPTVFYKTFGLDSETRNENFQTPPRSQQSDSFAPRGATKRTWSYYQKMRKDNPTLYYDPKTNIQMQEDAITLGKEFEDGDWNSL